MRPRPTPLPLFCCLIAAFLSAAPAPGGPTTATGPVEPLRKWLAQPRDKRPDLAKQAFATAPLTKEQAEQAKQLLWDEHAASVRESRAQEWKDEAITAAGKTLRFKSKKFGDEPKDGRSLFLSLHGGGGAPARVNDQQWENQVRLYEPKEGLYVAPRAPTDNWNLWHESHIDVLFDRLLADAFVLEHVNPNRVYVMGYSAGGDGVYQLAPRMADRWGAAAMMAGHPNDASPLGLRNIGFILQVGGRDSAFDRNKVAGEWKQKLDDLRAKDEKGYAHEVVIHEGLGHWMNRLDAAALPWMAKFTRDPLPPMVVWKQDDVTHDRLYWLAVPTGEAKAGSLVVASRKGQNVEIEQADGVDRLVVLLSDAMLDLDKPITITRGGRELFKGTPRRTVASLHETLAAREDPFLVFPAAVTVTLKAR